MSSVEKGPACWNADELGRIKKLVNMQRERERERERERGMNPENVDWIRRRCRPRAAQQPQPSKPIGSKTRRKCGWSRWCQLLLLWAPTSSLSPSSLRKSRRGRRPCELPPALYIPYSIPNSLACKTGLSLHSSMQQMISVIQRWFLFFFLRNGEWNLHIWNCCSLDWLQSLSGFANCTT